MTLALFAPQSGSPIHGTGPRDCQRGLAACWVPPTQVSTALSFLAGLWLTTQLSWEGSFQTQLYSPLGSLLPAPSFCVLPCGLCVVQLCVVQLCVFWSCVYRLSVVLFRGRTCSGYLVCGLLAAWPCCVNTVMPAAIGLAPAGGPVIQGDTCYLSSLWIRAAPASSFSYWCQTTEPSWNRGHWPV